MKKLIIKGIIYSVLIVFALEAWVRIFHLSKDNPVRFVDDKKVEKWMPNQDGHSVTGNRRQNFSKFHINNSGFNSYREFTPSKDKMEVALVGDSFIEGFHQHYYNSIGKKIENTIGEGIEVYEYGYAGYDMADQLHLINVYEDQFALIDYVVLGIKFSNDLSRGKYEVVQSRLRLESPLYKTLRKSKLLVYAQNMGILDPPKNMITKIVSGIRSKKEDKKEKSLDDIRVTELGYIKNFESLVNTYGFDKQKYVFLLDSKNTSNLFMEYLDTHKYRYIDSSKLLSASKQPTTLIYDRHWNNHGRNLIAQLIAEHLLREMNKKQE